MTPEKQEEKNYPFKIPNPIKKKPMKFPMSSNNPEIGMQEKPSNLLENPVNMEENIEQPIGDDEPAVDMNAGISPIEEDELMELAQLNRQHVSSLTNEVRDVESRLIEVETVVKDIEGEMRRIEKKLGKSHNFVKGLLGAEWNN